MPARPVGARAHRHPPRKTRRPPPRARGGKKRRWSRPRRSDRIGFRPPAALPTPSPRVRAPRRRWIGWWGFRRANRRRFAASSRFFRREFVLPGRCLDLGCGACVEWEWEEGIELLSFFSCNRPWRFLECSRERRERPPERKWAVTIRARCRPTVVYMGLFPLCIHHKIRFFFCATNRFKSDRLNFSV